MNKQAFLNGYFAAFEKQAGPPAVINPVDANGNAIDMMEREYTRKRGNSYSGKSSGSPLAESFVGAKPNRNQTIGRATGGPPPSQRAPKAENFKDWLATPHPRANFGGYDSVTMPGVGEPLSGDPTTYKYDPYGQVSAGRRLQASRNLPSIRPQDIANPMPQNILDAIRPKLGY